MKKAKIHLEFTMTPLFNSAYIEGINNLYEFDCGEQSGWLYSVNGEFPNYGCSSYKAKTVIRYVGNIHVTLAEMWADIAWKEKRKLRTVYNLHPTVSFLYYVLMIVFSVCIMHPVCIVLSILSSVLFAIKLSGRKMLKFYLMFILPTALVAAVLNPLFNHQGVTILAYFPNGNPLTKESLLYGFAASGMLASVMSWFYSFNLVTTSDKIVYLFGKVTPSLSLLISMILRFVPNVKHQLSEISIAQKGMGIYNKNKIKAALSVMSAEMTVALESAVITADSMKSRGFGTEKRTFYSCYEFRSFDKFALLIVAAAGIAVIILWASNVFRAVFYPVVTMSKMPVFVIVLYGIFCFMPLISECVEEIRWNVLKSKI